MASNFIDNLMHQKRINKINFFDFFKYFIVALASEGILIWLLGLHPNYTFWCHVIIIIFGALSSLGILFLAVEVVRDIDEATNMIIGLFSVVILFVVYFAFQYWFLLITTPDSFSTLVDMGPINLLLQSTMIFLFNPLIIPATKSAQLLVLTDSFGSFFLVAFILQNIWQFRHRGN